MEPARYDFKIWVGNHHQWRLALKDGADDPVAIAGSDSVRVTVFFGKVVVLAKDLTIIDGPTGVVELAMTPEETRAMSYYGSAKHEIELRQSGEETTLIYGLMVCSGGDNEDQP